MAINDATRLPSISNILNDIALDRQSPSSSHFVFSSSVSYYNSDRGLHSSTFPGPLTVPQQGANYSSDSIDLQLPYHPKRSNSLSENNGSAAQPCISEEHGQRSSVSDSISTTSDLHIDIVHSTDDSQPDLASLEFSNASSHSLSDTIAVKPRRCTKSRSRSSLKKGRSSARSIRSSRARLINRSGAEDPLVRQLLRTKKGKEQFSRQRHTTLSSQSQHRLWRHGHQCDDDQSDNSEDEVELFVRGLRPWLPKTRLNSNNRDCSGLEATKEETMQASLDRDFWLWVHLLVERLVWEDIMRTLEGQLGRQYLSALKRGFVERNLQKVIVEETARLLQQLQGELRFECKQRARSSKHSPTVELASESVDEVQLEDEPGIVNFIASYETKTAQCARLQERLWKTLRVQAGTDDEAVLSSMEETAKSQARVALRGELQGMREEMKFICKTLEKVDVKKSEQATSAASLKLESLDFRIKQYEQWVN